MTGPSPVPVDIGPIGWVMIHMPNWMWDLVLSWAGVTNEAIEDLFNPLTDRNEKEST